MYKGDKKAAQPLEHKVVKGDIGAILEFVLQMRVANKIDL